MLYEDETGIRSVGTLADVEEVVHRFEDGRLNVVVAGRRRFRLVDWTEGRSFRTAEIEPVDDEDDPAEPGRCRARRSRSSAGSPSTQAPRSSLPRPGRRCSRSSSPPGSISAPT